MANYAPRALAQEPAGISKDRRGSVSMLAALTLPIIISLAALYVDYGFALSQRAALQQVADSAALAGAMAYKSTASATATNATIKDVVVANGWASSAIVTGSTGYLATSPTNASVQAVQVTLAASSPLWFGSALLSRSTLGFTAYSLANLAGSPTTCIISFSTLMLNSVMDAGTCDVAANSTESYAVQVNSSGGLTAGKFYTPGTITDDGYIHATIVSGTKSDPYTSVGTAASAGLAACSSLQYYTSGTSTMSPGCWNGPTISTAVTLSPGIYYMMYGMTLNSGGSITGTGGVTIVSSTTLALDGDITLTAPTSGPYSGIALVIPYNASKYYGGGYTINNNVHYTINGVIYAQEPDTTGTITVDSGTSNEDACTYIVAGAISFNGGATFALPSGSCTGGSSGGSLGLAK